MALPKIAISVNPVKIKAYAPFALLAALILAEVLFLAFYLPGKVFELLDLRDKTTSLSSDVKQLMAANSQLAAVDENQLNSALNIAEVALPDEKKVAGLIAGLGKVASSSAVAVKSISFSPGQISTASGQVSVGASDLAIGDGVRAIPVNMSVASSLTNFLDYLNKLQSASQLLGVTGINYSLPSQTSGGEMSLLVYYLPARTGRPTWQYIPPIEATDLEVLSKLSPADIFILPGATR